MVNTGKPSSGCYPCRRRRVRCDGARPSCIRCRRGFRACHGYRQETNLLFKDETLTTIKRSTNALLKQAVPKKVLSISNVDQSLCLFFATYVIVPQNEEDSGYLDYLPSMYLEATQGSCLVQTVHAVALIYMYNKGSHIEVKRSARRYYGSALKTINEALQNPIECLSDSTLLSIWLIQNYEILIGELFHFAEKSPAWTWHMEGLSNLLRLRGTQQLQTRRGRGIFSLAYGTAKMYALMAGKRSPLHDWQPLLDWRQKARLALPGPPGRGSDFHDQVADLCCQIKSLPKFSTYQTDIYEHALYLKKVALDLDKSAQDWPGDDPKWQPRFVSRLTTPPDTVQSCGRPVQYFRDFFTLRHWNFFRAVRIVLHETLLHFDQINRGSTAAPASSQSSTDCRRVLLSNDERRCCSKIIADMADNILDTLPFLFGEVDRAGQMPSLKQGDMSILPGQILTASMSIWLLRMIKMSEYTSSPQKDLATEALYRIGRTIGVRQALTAAAASSKRPL